jgi:nucleoid-associated protein YgaU
MAAQAAKGALVFILTQEAWEQLKAAVGGTDGLWSKLKAYLGRRAIVYTVQKGDTLGRIAAAHGTSVERILASNGDAIKDPNKIYPGQRVVIVQ